MVIQLSDPEFLAMMKTVHDDPFCNISRGILADFIEEHRPIGIAAAESLRQGRIPLLSFEIGCAKSLACCNFAPATWDKKFSYSIAERATSKGDLTPKQYLWMWILLRRYRKSVLDPEVRKEAEARYDRCIELMDIQHLKSIHRRTDKKTDMNPNLFD